MFIFLLLHNVYEYQYLVLHMFILLLLHNVYEYQYWFCVCLSFCYCIMCVPVLHTQRRYKERIFRMSSFKPIPHGSGRGSTHVKQLANLAPKMI